MGKVVSDNPFASWSGDTSTVTDAGSTSSGNPFEDWHKGVVKKKDGGTDSSPSSKSQSPSEEGDKGFTPAPAAKQYGFLNQQPTTLLPEAIHRASVNYKDGNLTGDDIALLSGTNFGKQSGLNNIPAEARGATANAYNVKTKLDPTAAVGAIQKTYFPALKNSIPNSEDVFTKFQNGDLDAIKTVSDHIEAMLKSKIKDVEGQTARTSFVMAKEGSASEGLPLQANFGNQKTIDNLQNQINSINATLSEYSRLSDAKRQKEIAGSSLTADHYKIGENQTKYFGDQAQYRLEQKAAKGIEKIKNTDAATAEQNLIYKNTAIGLQAMLDLENLDAAKKIYEGYTTNNKSKIDEANTSIKTHQALQDRLDNLDLSFPSVALNRVSKYVAQEISDMPSTKLTSEGFITSTSTNSDIQKAITKIKTETPELYNKYKAYFDQVNPRMLPSKSAFLGGVGIGLDELGFNVSNVFKGDAQKSIDELNRQSQANIKGAKYTEPLKIINDKEGNAFREVENEDYSQYGWNTKLRGIGQGLPTITEWALLTEATGGLFGMLGEGGDVGVAGIEGVKTGRIVGEGTTRLLSNIPASYIMTYDENSKIADGLVTEKGTAGDVKKNIVANVLTLLTPVAFEAMEFSPNEAMFKLFQNSTAKELISVIDKKGIEGLTKSDLSSFINLSVKPKVASILKSFVKGGSAMVLNQKLDDLVTVITNPKAPTSTLQENVNSFVQNGLMILATGLPGLVREGFSPTYKDFVYRGGLFRDEYKQVADDMRKAGAIDQKKFNEVSVVLNTINEEINNTKNLTNEKGLPLTYNQRRDIAVNNFRKRAAEMLDKAGHSVETEKVSSEADGSTKEVLKEESLTPVEESETFKQFQSLNPNVKRLSDIDPAEKYVAYNDKGATVKMSGADVLNYFSIKKNLNDAPLTTEEFNQWNELTPEQKRELARQNLPDVQDLSNRELIDVADQNAKRLLKGISSQLKPDTYGKDKEKEANAQAEGEKRDDVTPAKGLGTTTSSDTGAGKFEPAPTYKPQIRDDYFARADFFTPEEKKKFETLDEAGRDKMIDDKRAELKAAETQAKQNEAPITTITQKEESQKTEVPNKETVSGTTTVAEPKQATLENVVSGIMGNQGLAMMDADIRTKGEMVIKNIDKATDAQKEKIKNDFERLKELHPEKNLELKEENNSYIIRSKVKSTEPTTIHTKPRTEFDIEADRSHEIHDKFKMDKDDADRVFAKTNEVQKRFGVSYNGALELQKQYKELNEKYDAELKKPTTTIPTKEQPIEDEKAKKPVEKTDVRTPADNEPSGKQKVEGLKEQEDAGKPVQAERKTLADKIRSGKIDKNIMMSGIPFAKQVWNGAVEAVAKAVELTGDIKAAIERGIEHIRNSDWYKGLGVREAQRAEDKFRIEFDDVAKDPDVAFAFAPYRSRSVLTEEQDEKIRSEAGYKQFHKNIDEAATGLGVKVIGKHDTWGGYVDKDGNPVKEVSNVFYTKGSKDQAEVIAAVVGKIAPEQQESVLIGNYDKSGDGHEHVIATGDFDHARKAIDFLDEAGLQYFTIDKKTGDVIILDPDNSNFWNILTFVDKLNENGIKAEHIFQPVSASFIDEGSYDGIIAEKGRKIGQQNGFDVDAFVSRAKESYGREAADTRAGRSEVKVNSEGVRYNGRDAIGSRARSKSDKDNAKKIAKEKIKNPDTNASLKAANEYNQSVGLPEVTQHEFKPSDPELQGKIAKLYPKLQDVNRPNYKETSEEKKIYNSYKKKYPKIFDEYDIKNYRDLVKKSYAQLITEVNRQFESLPVKVDFHEGDKDYDSSAEMLDDVHNFNHLWVFKGGDDHTELGSKTTDENGLTANDKFRVVHDYFGHSVDGYQFGKDGEENAWIEHSKMFSPLAQWALSSETRGQNSFVNYSGVNERTFGKMDVAGELKKRGLASGNQEMVDLGNKLLGEAKSDFKFAEQKSILLPPEFTDTSRYHDVKITEMPSGTREAKDIEGRRKQAIEEANKLKPENFKLKLVKTDDIINSDDPVGNKIKHDDIKRKYIGLHELVKCIERG